MTELMDYCYLSCQVDHEHVYAPEDLKRVRRLTEPQTLPTPNTNPAIWDLVIDDIRNKDKTGATKYGTRLQGFNGRRALVDAYQEALDLTVYLRQRIWEEDNGSGE